MQAIRHDAHLETAIARAVAHQESHIMGSGYADVKVCLLRDLIVVRCWGAVHSPAEQQLAGTQRGRMLIRQLHHAAFEQYCDGLKDTVATLTASPIENVFMDFDVPAGEKVLVFTLGSEAQESRAELARYPQQ